MSRRFDETRLPEEARERLLSLDEARIASEDAARAAKQRINNMGAASDPRLAERLAASAERHRQQFEALSGLTNAIRAYLSVTPPNVMLEVAPPTTAKVLKGENLPTAVARVRAEIVALKSHLRTVQTAPVPKDELKKQAAQIVLELARSAPVKVSAGARGLNVNFADAAGDTLSHHAHIGSLLAWAAPDLLLRAIQAQIDTLPELAAPMPTAEREKRAGELAAQLLDAERIEEALIDRAALDGIEIARRENADARAVLGIEIAAKETAQAA